MVSAVIVAAGSGTRMGAAVPKPFLTLHNRPVLAWSLSAFQNAPEVDEIVVVTKPEFQSDVEEMARRGNISKLAAIVPGGAVRLASVRNGLQACASGADFILVHDAARPCVTPDLIAACLASARQYGSGVAAAPVVDTLKAADAEGCVQETVDRTGLWAVQTPQAFRADWLREAIDAASDTDAAITDEAAALERIGRPVRLVRNPAPNLKLTVPGDFAVLSALLPPNG